MRHFQRREVVDNLRRDTPDAIKSVTFGDKNEQSFEFKQTLKMRFYFQRTPTRTLTGEPTVLIGVRPIE